MNDFATITPTRGDRPQFIAHCKWQLSRMTVKPGKSYFIDYAPKTIEKDLSERVQFGISLAKEDGFDKCYIVEDDDFLPVDYFERMAFLNADFVGDNRTFYYHLKNNGIDETIHKGRSSLFTTGFRISKLVNFRWPTGIFIDIKLWEYARNRRLKTRFADSGAVGIKHGYGITGGIGHKTTIYKRFDTNWEWLRSKVDKESLEFYMSVNKQYA